ncbi:DoxX family protein [Vreelandella sulfidaeris]|uniref:DoxX family protein n=1 Tax=Vreelandella sulfidaeris TaxID=115553 RepID=UPI0035E65A3F
MPRIPLLVISLFFFAGGLAHFVFTDFFVMAMPDYLGYHQELVLISGIFELAGAMGILVPKTRFWAGCGLIVLIAAVYPANINMALHPEQYPEIPRLLLYARLPLQFLMAWFVWWSIKAERLERKVTV